MDKYGNVAYATTTGGINAKLPGRLGDSSIPGIYFLSFFLYMWDIHHDI